MAKKYTGFKGSGYDMSKWHKPSKTEQKKQLEGAVKMSLKAFLRRSGINSYY